MQHRKCFKLFVKLTKESEKITKQSEILWKKNWLSSQNMMWDTKKAKLLIFIFTTTDVSAIDKEIRKPSYLILLIIIIFIKVALTNVITILIMSAKLATLDPKWL